MKYSRIINAVYGKPWLITMDGLQAVHAVLEPHLRGAPLPAGFKASWIDDEDDDDEKEEPKLYDIVDGAAIVSVSGTLMRHASVLAKMCGACSYDDVTAALEAAKTDPAVNRVVLNIDSPGGEAVGCMECGGVVAEASLDMPVIAYTDGQMCSAALAISAGATKVFCAPTAIVGSIGTVLGILDESEAYKDAGYKMQVFSTGKYKGAGWPGTKLTKEQAAYFQGMVDDLGGQFKAHMRAYRGTSEDDMQGQAFVGAKAMESGLVDGICSSLKECLSLTAQHR